VTRLGLAGLSLVALGAAAALSASSPRGAASAAASLGGARVVLVDALLVRADALRKEGRVEDLPAVYRRILELDPGSDLAVDHLADVLGNDLRTLGPTPEARVRWWDEADALVREAIRRDPRSARLRFRAAELRLVTGAQDDAVAAALTARGVDRERDGLEYLAESAARAASIPRLGFAHLDALVRWAPRIAAERLARGDGDTAAEALAIARAVLHDREAALNSFLVAVDPARTPLPAGAVLTARTNLVGGVRDALAARPPRAAEARMLFATYVQVLGKDDVSEPLEPLLAR
jgi:hypothetical protein